MITELNRNLFEALLLQSIMEPVQILLNLYGESYSSLLGVDPKTEPFKWLLASVLYGAPIQENIAAKTYKEFEKRSITTPEKITETGRHSLVDILDQCGYTRYDFKTADKLLELADKVREEGIPYSEEEIVKLAKGIGRVTANIFLRELRNNIIDPEPQEYVYEAAENLGLLKERTLQGLKDVWARNRVENYTFVNFETALLKLGKNFCRKRKHETCQMKKWCTLE